MASFKSVIKNDQNLNQGNQSLLLNLPNELQEKIADYTVGNGTSYNCRVRNVVEYSLLCRQMYQICQGSTYIRNNLCQPAPISVQVTTKAMSCIQVELSDGTISITHIFDNRKVPASLERMRQLNPDLIVKNDT